MTSPQVSVVIPAYNAAHCISGQLDALRAQVDAPTFEVIVADNRSTDGTAQAALAAAEGLDLRVVPAMRRQGVNCARNAGVAAAQADIIVFVDADDRIGVHAVRSLIAPIVDDPSLGVVGGVMATDASDTHDLPSAQGYLQYAPGCFMALRREAFDAVGGFDENFVGGHDEVDLCWRVQQSGFGIGLARDALMERVERSTARAAYRQFRRYGFTYIQLFVKHRAHGIDGSSPMAEKPVVKRVLKQIPRALSGSPDDRRDAAGFIGWHVGRWQGDLRFRTWGPK